MLSFVDALKLTPGFGMTSEATRSLDTIGVVSAWRTIRFPPWVSNRLLTREFYLTAAANLISPSFGTKPFFPFISKITVLRPGIDVDLVSTEA